VKSSRWAPGGRPLAVNRGEADMLSLPIKNTLTRGEAEAVEAAYVARLAGCSEEHSVSSEAFDAPEPSSKQAALPLPPTAGELVAPLTKTARKRSKAHLAFVASQPCLVCKMSPSDAHHLKIAQPRSLGRKVSDEFTVPLCRQHHHELHKHGKEANWWANLQLTPIPIAKEVWETSPVHGGSKLLPLEPLGPTKLDHRHHVALYLGSISMRVRRPSLARLTQTS
jgi:hypothetical protein